MNVSVEIIIFEKNMQDIFQVLNVFAEAITLGAFFCMNLFDVTCRISAS